MKKLLLIDDSKEIHQLVCIAVAGYADIVWCANITESHQALKQHTFDIVLLDIELPDGNGIDFCVHTSSTFPGLPIFLLTSKTTLSEKVLGFAAGADDYITKPVHPQELAVRIQAKVKKSELYNISRNVIEWTGLKIDKTTQQVFLRIEGNFKDVNLTRREFLVLMMLIDNADKIVSRDQLFNEVWRDAPTTIRRAVDKCVSNVRRKLGEHGFSIKTFHGSGYMFTPPD